MRNLQVLRNSSWVNEWSHLFSNLLQYQSLLEGSCWIPVISKDVFCLRTEEPSEIVHISKGKHEKDKFKKIFKLLEGLQEV